jgi:hypothetical protein
MQCKLSDQKDFKVFMETAADGSKVTKIDLSGLKLFLRLDVL